MIQLARIVTVFLVSVCALGEGAAERPLNVVWMVADDLGWRDLGCYGSSFYETPRLDSLAAEGAKFTQAYAACPVCSPTRASLMTGKYPQRTATTDYFGAPQPDGVDKHWTANKPLLPAPYNNFLPLEEVTIAEALLDAGYKTFHAGKWHLGAKGFLPENQGFEVNIGGGFGGGLRSYFPPYQNPSLPDGPEGEHLPLRLARETATFIQANREQPFFAYLAFHSVHIPLQARADLEKKYVEKKRSLPETPEVWGQERDSKVRLVQDLPVYAAMVEGMDEAVGIVLDALAQAGLAENTLVLFTSDNGGLATAEGHPTSNLPLRGGKGWLYEGGVRVPLLVRWPGVAEGGTVVNAPVFSGDLYPTSLEAAGQALRPEQHLDGKSLKELLRGERSKVHDELFWHYPHYGNQGNSPSAAMRQGDWKLITCFEDDTTELYRLDTDAGERQNLAESEAERTTAMLNRLKEWQASVGARFPTPNPAAAQDGP